MKMNSKYQKILFQILLGIVFLTGISLRLLVYWQGRAFFLDEANVVRIIDGNDYADFFSPLEQFIPPLLSIVFKLCTDLFGVSEYSVRLFPLLIGIISLFLFYHLIRKIIDHPFIRLFLLWVFSCSYLLVQYAAEAKQYGVDVFVTIFLFNFFIDKNGIINIPKKWREGILITIILQWLSMSTIFVLSGIGMAYMYQCWKQKEIKNNVHILLSAAWIWLLNFFIYYYFILSYGASDVVMQVYHAKYFLPFIPLGADEISQWWNIQEEILNSTIGKTAIAIIFGIVFIMVGWISIARKNIVLLILFSCPIFFAWLASSLGYYSLLPRLALFYLPISLCFIGKGLEVGLGQQYLKYPIGILMLLVATNQWGYKMFWEPYQKEEIKPVLRYIVEQSEKDDHIYIHYDAVPAFEVYTYRHVQRKAYYPLLLHPLTLTAWDTPHPNQIKTLPDRVWVLVSHLEMDQQRQYAEQFSPEYHILDEYESYMASCYLLVRK